MLSISSLHNIPLSVHYYALVSLPGHTLLVPLTVIFLAIPPPLPFWLSSLQWIWTYRIGTSCIFIPYPIIIALSYSFNLIIDSYLIRFMHIVLFALFTILHWSISLLSLLDFPSCFSWLSICFPCNALGGLSSDVG